MGLFTPKTGNKNRARKRHIQTVSPSLADIIIPKAFLPKGTYWDALQEIANAVLCRVYIDRNDRITVTVEEDDTKLSKVSIHSGNAFSATSNITLTEFANQIEVEYTEVVISEDLIETAELELILTPNEVASMSLDYTSEIADAFIESNNANIKISNFNSGINACEFILKNMTNAYQVVILKVTGNAILQNTRTVTINDEDSIRNFGVTQYTHPASELVQSYEHASYIASTLLKKMQAGEGVVGVVWRGNTSLELGAEYEYIDRFGGSKRLICEYNKLTYDGSLKQETRGRKT